MANKRHDEEREPEVVKGSPEDRLIHAVVKRRTIEGLPVVTNNTLTAFLRDCLQRGKEGIKKGQIEDIVDSSYVESMDLRMMSENGNLHDVLSDYAEKLGQNEGERKIYKFMFLMTYELLKRQAEANKLEEDFYGNHPT